MSRTTRNRNRNLAARMGRWSAAHWKTATFGWLAFVVVAFALGGMVGTKSIDPNATGPGESGRMDRILDAGFKQPAGESVLIQSRTARAGDARLHAAVADVVARVSKLADVRNVRSRARKIAERRARRARRVRHPRRQGQGGRQDRPRPRRASPLRNAPIRASSSASSATRARQKGVDTAYRGRPREGGRALAPDHADHPRAHVRRARRGRHSAAARADRRLRDVRAGRAAQPRAPVAQRGVRDGAPDRARGRRRLLDVLLEARAPGAGRRAQPSGPPRSGRRDLRPLGAHLRPDGDGRDGGHVPDRRHDLLVARRSPRSSSSPSRCSGR